MPRRRNDDQPSRRFTLASRDVSEVSEGTVIAAFAAVIVWAAKVKLGLDPAIETAAMVLAYAAARAAFRFFTVSSRE